MALTLISQLMQTCRLMIHGYIVSSMQNNGFSSTVNNIRNRYAVVGLIHANFMVVINNNNNNLFETRKVF